MNTMQLVTLAKQIDERASRLPGAVTITNILLVDHGSPLEYVQVDLRVLGLASGQPLETRRITVKTSELT